MREQSDSASNLPRLRKQRLQQRQNPVLAEAERHPLHHPTEEE